MVDKLISPPLFSCLLYIKNTCKLPNILPTNYVSDEGRILNYNLFFSKLTTTFPLPYILYPLHWKIVNMLYLDIFVPDLFVTRPITK